MRRAPPLRSILVVLSVMLLPMARAAETTSPQRIVSLVPSVTEIIYRMGEQHRLAGVSDFCKYPPEAQKKPKVGGLLDPDIEAIIRLRPDLVFAHESHAELVEKLQRIGVQSKMFRTDSLEDVFSNIDEIGRTLDATIASQPLANELRQRIDAIRRRYADTADVRTLIVVGRQPDSLQNIYAAGSGTYLGQLLEIAGGKNVAPASAQPYPTISKEEIVKLNPDVIIDTSLGEAAASHALQEKHREVWNQLKLMKAYRDKRIHYIEDPYLTIPGPGLVETAKAMEELLHK